MVAFIKRFIKPKINSELIQIQTSQKLLEKHKVIIDNIYHSSQVPKEHWIEYYLLPIAILAEYLQSLQASQNHHHSYTGGFLVHTLEVIDIALKKRHTYMLPIGASVETQSMKKDLWTYAVFTCALSHDIGKIISDITVLLFDKQGKKLGRWTPFSGPMNNIPKAYYYISFCFFASS